MEMRILEDNKKRLVFELKGVQHTFMNSLKQELRNDEHVTVTSYNISHQLVSEPLCILETDGKDPRTTLVDAAKHLQKANEKFEKAVAKDLKK
ncbi:DNA-directed RNA polymerase subunit L [Candidatus Woesearchaeota archaeon]|nr:DNA-directed RNA polymerase subunit L [Candidatus Woesearchaeota archaeon]